MASKENRTRTKPTFSIIVPAYNSSLFIDKCINSVLGQTYHDFELLLIDDGSKDNTFSICNEYARKDERIVVFHQENQGHTSARNLGLLNSKGEYVLFLDSDDWIDLDTLEVCGKNIENYKPDVIVFGNCQNAGNSMRILKNQIPDGFYSLSDKESFIIERLLMPCDEKFAFPKSLSGKVFKREKVLKYQLSIPSDIIIGEDGACFVSTVLASDTISVMSDVYYHALVRSNSVSHSADKYALRRCLTLLQYYQTILNIEDMTMLEQYKRFVVAQIYTAVQFVSLSNCDNQWLAYEFKNVVSYDFIKDSIQNAQFNKSGMKMKIKQFILRHAMFWLIKLQMRSKKR